jgi:hypothetical protein
MRYEEVSFIKDLMPELSDIENENGYNATMVNDVKRQPAIRNKMMSMQNGMETQNTNTEQFYSSPPGQPLLPTSMQFQNSPQMPPYYHNQPQNVIPISPNPENNGVNELIENFSSCDCRTVYDHISSCPICKKFYVNDNTVYLIIIAILVVVCALLLKRVLHI